LYEPERRVVEPASEAEPFLRPGTQLWRQGLATSALIISDALLAFLTWYMAYLVQSTWGRGELTQASIVSAAANVVLWIGLRAVMGLYPGYGLHPAEELRRQTYAVLIVLSVTSVFSLAFHLMDLLSRLLLVSAFLGLLFLTPVLRHVVKGAMSQAGLWGKPVVVFGAGETGARLVRALQDEWALGFRPVAVFDNRLAPVSRALEGVPYGGTLTKAMGAARRWGVDTAIFAMPQARRKYLSRFVGRASRNFRNVVIIPDLIGLTSSVVVARDLAGIFGVEVKHNLLNPWALRAKRVLDVWATVVGGILIFPLFVLLCLLVYKESRGEVFYRDHRMGRDGKLFSCIKFRTMVPDAEAELQRILKENAEAREEYSKYHKLRRDPRITRIGGYLRRTSLDELPQLWNVLRGEMSLVGPRPYLSRESGDVGAAQEEILRVPPGVTGPWQVAGRNHASFGERVRLDTYYVRNWSVWLDLVILARTVGSVFFSRGAF